MENNITEFELTSLAFAYLIQLEAGNEDIFNQDYEEKIEKLGPFETIRCICGNNINNGDLIQCHECKSFLHRECVEFPLKKNQSFRCPFCKLQLEGIDPFRELTSWVELKNSEISSIHHLIEEIMTNSQQNYQSYPYDNSFLSRNNNNNNNNRIKKISELVEKAKNIHFT